ncbi:ATP-grasp domain-containing protein [Larkinella knui]|uniref:ATP-grasp domain-containing protein n=1 Tax=Larkinella knui TaxID=2025310 RepID=A0A3P1CPZ7_9BACT|nr:ATP-grasp domain-containing protein [Larkinella knui]RRB15136.1 ATP-grasp domain-containing protein [Larkinella knui]
MSKLPVTIAVTGLNNSDNPGPGIPVIRSLRESRHLDVRIIGLSYENLEPGVYMDDLVDMVYAIPYPSLGHETLLARLTYIHEQESLDLIIPNFDAELFSFIKISDTLAGMGIRTLLPTQEQFDARLKGKLVEFGDRFAINVPKSLTVFNADELTDALGEFSYPVVVKGKFYEAYVAQTAEQAHGYFYKLAAKWGTPVILQQFIKGQEYNITALGDGKGRLMGAVAMRKTYITPNGKGWAGVSIDDENLLDMARKVVTQTRWGGGMELELMQEDSTGDVYLIEINPRFPAWVYLATACGQNHPDRLVRLALGQHVDPQEDYEVGKMFVRYSWDMICDLSRFQEIATTGEVAIRPMELA